MADIVNSAYNHSLQWQAPLTWMRVNFAYIRSELDELAGVEDEPTEGITKLLPQFEASLARFIQEEARLFLEARTSERSPAPGAISRMLLPLMAMRSAFDEFKHSFHLEVMRLRLIDEDCSTLALCHCCGAEMFSSHNKVCEGIGNLMETIEANLR
jgi:hypothetical protein